jgi:hypothetical protein
LLKHVIGIALRPIHRKHKLAVLVRSSTRLFDFEAVVGSGMEPHIGQPDRWRDEMIKRGVARYNWKTGVWEWEPASNSGMRREGLR